MSQRDISCAVGHHCTGLQILEGDSGSRSPLHTISRMSRIYRIFQRNISRRSLLPLPRAKKLDGHRVLLNHSDYICLAFHHLSPLCVFNFSAPLCVFNYSPLLFKLHGDLFSPFSEPSSWLAISTGNGKTIVWFFSDEIEFSV